MDDKSMLSGFKILPHSTTLLDQSLECNHRHPKPFSSRIPIWCKCFPWQGPSFMYALCCDDSTLDSTWSASRSLIMHQAGMKQRATNQGYHSTESSRPDPVWYFPAAHHAQLTSAISPDPEVCRWRTSGCTLMRVPLGMNG